MNTKEYNRNYYLKNKEQMREKRNKRELERYYKNRDNEGVEQRKREARERSSHPCYTMFNSAKTRAKKAGIEFSITLNDLVIPEICPISLRPLTRDGLRGDSPSLDRVDNSKGYTRDNIRIISNRCNSRKGDLSLEEIKRLYLYTKV